MEKNHPNHVIPNVQVISLNFEIKMKVFTSTIQFRSVSCVLVIQVNSCTEHCQSVSHPGKIQCVRKLYRVSCIEIANKIICMTVKLTDQPYSKSIISVHDYIITEI